jgi:hypothetical protein
VSKWRSHYGNWNLGDECLDKGSCDFLLGAPFLARYFGSGSLFEMGLSPGHYGVDQMNAPPAGTVARFE